MEIDGWLEEFFEKVKAGLKSDYLSLNLIPSAPTEENTMDSFFATVTWLGSLAILLPLSALLSAIFFSLQKGTEGVFIMLSLLGTSAITHLLKILIARPRPAVENLIVAMPSDFSFPSAHTSQATAVAIALCLVAAGKVGQPTVFLIWGVCITLAGLVGYSRVYLRVHYLTDVIAGATVGLFCVFVFAQIFGTFRRQ